MIFRHILIRDACFITDGPRKFICAHTSVFRHWSILASSVRHLISIVFNSSPQKFDCRKKKRKGEKRRVIVTRNRNGGGGELDGLYIDFQICSNGFFFLLLGKKTGFKCLSSMYNYKNEKDPILIENYLFSPLF